MAITLTDAVKNVSNDAIADLVDGGTTNLTGRFVVMDAIDTTLCEIDLQDPAFGSSLAGIVAVLGTPLTGIATAAGTAALFKVVDRDEVELWRGSVTAAGGGGDAIIDNVTIAISDTVQLNSHSLTL